MRIILNGAPVEGAPTVADLVEHHLGRREPAGVAVALNDAIVPRGEWATQPLRDGDVVEVVTAVQGG